MDFHESAGREQADSVFDGAGQQNVVGVQENDEPMLPKHLARVIPAATLDRLRSRRPSALRPRLGALFVLLALGWPMILPGLLSLAPGYVELEFNGLAALVWVWFPAAVTLLVGLLMLSLPVAGLAIPASESRRPTTLSESKNSRASSRAAAA